jgi:hypothetical protein
MKDNSNSMIQEEFDKVPDEVFRAVDHHLKEWFTCFRLVAFDKNGNECVLTYAPNDLRYRALHDLTRSFVNYEQEPIPVMCAESENETREDF